MDLLNQETDYSDQREKMQELEAIEIKKFEKTLKKEKNDMEDKGTNVKVVHDKILHTL